MPFFPHLSIRIRHYATGAYTGALILLLTALIAGCALMTRKRPLRNQTESMETRPIPAADLAAIKAKLAESETAAAELRARSSRPDPRE